MGVLLPVTLDVPTEIAGALAEGSLVRYGSMVRDLGGHVVKNLAEFADEPMKDAAQAGPEAGPGLSSSSQAVIVVLAAGAAVAAGLGVMAVTRAKARRRAKALQRSPEVHLEAARAGRLSVEEIDCVIDESDRASEETQLAALEVVGRDGELLDGYTVLAMANNMSPVPTSPELAVDRVRGTL